MGGPNDEGTRERSLASVVKEVKQSQSFAAPTVVSTQWSSNSAIQPEMPNERQQSSQKLQSLGQHECTSSHGFCDQQAHLGITSLLCYPPLCDLTTIMGHGVPRHHLDSLGNSKSSVANAADSVFSHNHTPVATLWIV